MPRSAANALIASTRPFQIALLDWYRANARRLPWRESPSLYKTVVSEFMLQQTQVKTVLPYFARWLTALPDFGTLAAAEEAQVLRLWEGLGYYSRARNLHRLARELAARKAVPRTPEEWQELPGIGPYTAAAITSISFGAPAACVDGNVVRILARLTADPTEFRDSASAAKMLWPLATQLLPPSHPGDHNQAMMELGATVCVRARPNCLLCPVRSFCAAAQLGKPEEYPRLARTVLERQSVARVWCERRGSLLLHRAADDARRFAGMHELPLANQIGLGPALLRGRRLLAKKTRGITRFHITESIHLVPAPRGNLGRNLVWVQLDELDSVALSGPHRRWVREIIQNRQKR